MEAFNVILNGTEAGKIWDQYKDDMKKVVDKIDDCYNKPEEEQAAE